ncbi:MAG: hypothetical protein IID45_09055, partial [Planctomycetes bacterium]|nr:hypothetical protein [Planctomycetota bacterium]
MTVNLFSRIRHSRDDSGFQNKSAFRAGSIAVTLLRTLLLVAVAAITVCAEDAKPIAVTVQDVDGKYEQGELQSIDAKSITITSKKGRRSFALADVLSVELKSRARRSSRERTILYLANGDRIFARSVRTKDGDVLCEWMLLKATKTKDVIVPIKLRIPLTRVRGILF